MASSAKRHTQIDMLALEEDTGTPPTTVNALDAPPAPAIYTYDGKTEGRVGKRKMSQHAEQASAAATRDGRLKRPASSIADPSRIGVTTGSPWGRYDPVYTIDLAGSVELALSKVPPIRLVHVRTFAKPAIEKTLRGFRQVQHENIVAALEAFTTDDGLHVVLEYMPVSLEWIVRSPAYPDEAQLAAILGQVVHGLAYLAARRLQHGALSCSTVLLSTDGDVKIANQDACHPRLDSDTSSPDLKALSLITMELMQKYVKEGGAVGVDNLQRWHSGSDAVGFLSATTSAGSAAELLRHPLLARRLEKASLMGLISLAQVCTRGRYKFTM